MSPSTHTPSPTPLPTPPPGAAREGTALEAADHLTRTVVAVTGRLDRSVPPGLARTLREAAVLAHAGTTAACREEDPVRALRGLAATDHSLRRLGIWLDLARRFGDLSLDAAMELLEAQTRLRVVLAVLADRWRSGGHRREPSPVPHRA